MNPKVLVDSSLSNTIDYDGEGIDDRLTRFFSALGENILQKEEVFYSNGIDEDLISLGFNYIISDFQNVPDGLLNRMVADSSSQLTLLFTGDLNSVKNAYIDTVFLKSATEDVTLQELVIKLGISKSYTEGNVVVKLFHEDRQLSSIVKDVNEVNSISFDLPVESVGRHTISIAGDDVSFDNHFHFVLDQSVKPRIYILNNQPNKYLDQVFRNQSLFDVIVEASGIMDFESINDADLIVLNEMTELPTGLGAVLANKTVIVLPSVNYGNDESFGVRLIKNPEIMQYEIDLNYTHPLYSGVFEKQSNDVLNPNAMPVYLPVGEFETIIKLRNEAPFLIKSATANCYLFTAPLEDEYTNFPSHSSFLPLMYQIALRSVNHTSRLYYHPGDMLRLDVENRETPPKIVSEELEVIPAFNPDGEAVAVQLPVNLINEFYHLVHGGDTIRQIAVNGSKRESIMEAPSIDYLRSYLADHPHVSIGSLTDFTEALTSSKPKSNGLLKYALILILCLIITESLLHRYLK